MLAVFFEHSYDMHLNMAPYDIYGNGDCLGWLVSRSAALAIYCYFYSFVAKCHILYIHIKLEGFCDSGIDGII